VTADNLRPILLEQINANTKLMTDESSVYTKVGREFSKHGVTRHSIGEYVRGDIHSNTVEGYFSILKRGMTGVYQHFSADHLERSIKLLAGIQGKRVLRKAPAC
jgi:hypothetical protein